jgi:CHAT domain-containing protein
MKAEKNLFGAVDLLTLSACDTGVSGNGKEAEGFAYLAQSLGAKSVIASLWEVSDAGTPELMIRFYKIRAEHPEMAKGEAFRRAQISLLGAADKTAESKSDAAENSDADRSIKPIKPNNQKTDLPLFVKDAKKPFAHPHYWASFVLIGNWR